MSLLPREVLAETLAAAWFASGRFGTKETGRGPARLGPGTRATTERLSHDRKPRQFRGVYTTQVKAPV
jgi:hypothetical protein